MTSLEIEILLHYQYSVVDYRDGDFSAPAVRAAIDVFRAELGLLEPDTYTKGRVYRLTERARVYLGHIHSMPLPESIWVMPGPQGGEMTIPQQAPVGARSRLMDDLCSALEPGRKI